MRNDAFEIDRTLSYPMWRLGVFFLDTQTAPINYNRSKSESASALPRATLPIASKASTALKASKGLT